MRTKSTNADSIHEDPTIVASLNPEFPPSTGEALIDSSGTPGFALWNNRVWASLVSASVCHVLACLAAIDAPSQGHKGTLTDRTYRAVRRNSLDSKLFYPTDRSNLSWVTYRRAIVARHRIDTQLGPPPAGVLNAELVISLSAVTTAPSRCALAASGLV